MSTIQTIDFPTTENPSHLFYKIKTKFDPDVERVLICAECASYSISTKEIQAEFILAQFHQFSEMLFKNFNKTCFAEAIFF